MHSIKRYLTLNEYSCPSESGYTELTSAQCSLTLVGWEKNDNPRLKNLSPVSYIDIPVQ